MSIICGNESGYVISHQEFINKLYGDNFVMKNDLFAINTPFKTELQAQKIANDNDTRKRKKPSNKNVVPDEYLYQLNEVKLIEERYPLLIKSAQDKKYLSYNPSRIDYLSNNSTSRKFASEFYSKSTLNGLKNSFHGENSLSKVVIEEIDNEKYIFPPNCSFYCQDISSLCKENILNFPENGFNLITIDPPWWNKYIRRRKCANKNTSYLMLRTEDLLKIKINELLADDGLIAVWCTNCQSNIDAVLKNLFPKWDITYISTWYWLKVDNTGLPICNFSSPPGKQPYERIIFGRKIVSNNEFNNPEDNKIIISVPSAIHSHKPPLLELLKPYLPLNGKNLEIFARYLLPNTVSWGLEVLKLQHEFLFLNKSSSVSQ